MRLYNPTLEDQITKCNGNTYPIKMGSTISVTQFVGEFILQRWHKFGIVDATPNANDLSDYKNLVVKKTFEGLENYITHLSWILESCQQADTDQKSVNQYGTLLKGKEVRKVIDQLQAAILHKKNLQEKFGIDLARSEAENKSEILMSAIDQAVQDYNNNEEIQRKDREREAEISKVIESILPDLPQASL